MTIHPQANIQPMYDEMKRVKGYFPFRIVSGVIQADGKFEVFATTTRAKPRNYARKTGGQLYEFQ